MSSSYQRQDEPIILKSACKAHVVAGRHDPPVAEEDILHAYLFGEDVAANTTRTPPTYIVVGPGTEVTHLYEIGFFEAPDGPYAGRTLICHAMTARPAYERLFWRIAEEWT